MNKEDIRIKLDELENVVTSDQLVDKGIEIVDDLEELMTLTEEDRTELEYLTLWFETDGGWDDPVYDFVEFVNEILDRIA